MNQTKVSPSLIQTAKNRCLAEKKKLKHKKFLLKTKLTLTVILPVVLLLVASKVIKTFLQIKVRGLFTKTEDSALKQVPECTLSSDDPTQPVPPTQVITANMEPVKKTVFPLPSANTPQ